MANRTELWFEQDLKKPVEQRYVHGNFFSLDNNGTLLGVNVYDDGSPATLTGSATGYCVLADGTTVSVIGTRSGNQVYMTLPQSVLSIPGCIGIVLKLVDGSTITTVLNIVAMVYQSQTDTVITPSSQVITDWSNQINAALQAVEDASAAQDEKIADLKSALNEDGYLELSFSEVTGKSITAATGVASNSNSFNCTDYIWVGGFASLLYKRFRSTLTASAGMAFYDASKTYISGKTGEGGAENNYPVDDVIIVPFGAVYARFTYRADTTTYGTFSVKGSSRVYDRIKESEDEIRSVMDAAIGIEAMNFVRGTWKSETVAGIGETVSFDKNSPNCCAIMACEPGDQFDVRVKGPAGTSRGYFFCDASMKCITRADTNKYINKVLTAPTNAAYLCVSNNLSEMSAGYYAYKKQKGNDTQETMSNSLKNVETDVLSLGSMMMQNEDVLKNIDSESASGQSAGITYAWDEDVCTVSGTSTGLSFNTFRHISSTKFLPGLYRAQYNTTDEKIYVGIAVYDENNNITNHYIYKSGESYVYVPEGTSALRFRLYVSANNEISNATVTVNFNRVAIPEAGLSRYNRCDPNMLFTIGYICVKNENGILSLSVDGGQTYTKSLDISNISGLDEIQNIWVYEDLTLNIFGGDKAYYSHDWETIHQATVLDENGDQYTYSGSGLFRVLNWANKRTYINGIEMYVFGNYATTNAMPRFLWYSLDEGETYKVGYRFQTGGSSQTPINIRHVHFVRYCEEDGLFWIGTGDSSSGTEESHLIKGAYDYTNDTWTLTIVNSGRRYKWTGLDFYNGYAYYCYDICPGKAYKFKIGDEADASKHIKLIDNMPGDAHAIFVGYSGEIAIIISTARSTGGQPEPEINKYIAAKYIYYSRNGRDFIEITNYASKSEMLTKSMYLYATQPNAMGHILAIMNNEDDDTYRRAYYLDEIIRSAGYDCRF